MTETHRQQLEIELKDILDLLPSEHPDGEHRRHNLTRQDILLIAKLIEIKSRSAKCPMDLTKEEEVILKRGLKALSSGVSLVSMLIVTAIVLGALAIFTKGFWMTLFEAAKNTKTGG